MKNFSLILLLALITTGCDGLFEKNLEKETVSVVVPMDNYQSTNRTVNFKWDDLKGADAYRIQIVQTSFSNIQNFLLDSLVDGQNFSYTLKPGAYEWRVRAENNSSHTPYTTPRSIQIDSTNDLTGQTLSLLTPVNNGYTNKTHPVLTWLEIDIATGYDVIVKSGTDWLTGPVIESNSVSGDSYTISATLTEGEYVWGVRATNSTTQTDYFTRIIKIDLSTPGIPTNQTPVNNANINADDPITFSWTRSPDAGIIQSPKKDSLYIYTDATFQNLYQRYEINGTSYVDSIATPDTYYWRVKTFDDAGNIGAFGVHSTITIQ